MEIGEKIRAARKRAKFTQAQLAEACGWESQSRISNYENGTREPSLNDILLISSILGENLLDLSGTVFTKGNIYAIPSGKFSKSGKSTETDNPVSVPFAHPVTDVEGGTEPIPVPLYENQLAAGDGAAVYSEEPNGRIWFVREWLEKKGLPTTGLVAAEADGDSMRDYIHDGDTVLINTNAKKIKNGEVYAFRADSDLRIKRLFMNLNGSLTISSDNKTDPRYSDETVGPDSLDQINIIGHVVWRGG